MRRTVGGVRLETGHLAAAIESGAAQAMRWIAAALVLLEDGDGPARLLSRCDPRTLSRRHRVFATELAALVDALGGPVTIDEAGRAGARVAAAAAMRRLVRDAGGRVPGRLERALADPATVRVPESVRVAIAGAATRFLEVLATSAAPLAR